MTVNTISEVAICNLALARVGSTQTITSFADGSNEANQCAIFYPQNRDALLADFPWPWAESYANLAQVAGPEINGQVANAQWARSYRYPSDCLVMRRVVPAPIPSTQSLPQTTGTAAVYPYINQPWLRPVGDAYPISYGISSDATGRLICTDFYGIGAGLTAIYTRAVSDPSQFTPSFADALAWRVATDLAMGLAFSDAKRKYAQEMYETMIRRARAVEMNQMTDDIALVRYQSEVIRARWGG